MREKLRLSEREIEWYRPLVELYLTYGSVDQVFAKKHHNTGVSYPHFHRILKEWGIVKSTGPKSHLTEAIYFLTELAKERLPLETLYHSMPPSLQISAVTLHRILSYVKKGLTRRHATALIVSPESDPSLALIGKEMVTARPEIGKPIGSLSLPMTYAKRDEPIRDAILRVLQQEVAATLTVNRQLPLDLIPANPQTILTIDIADVRVKTIRLIIPNRLISHLDSFKLAHLTFVPLREIAAQAQDGLESHFRAGVPEISAGFLEIGATAREVPPHLDSLLNRQLALLPAYA